jgi:hypothetical protein
MRLATEFCRDCSMASVGILRICACSISERSRSCGGRDNDARGLVFSVLLAAYGDTGPDSVIALGDRR